MFASEAHVGNPKGLLTFLKLKCDEHTYWFERHL